MVCRPTTAVGTHCIDDPVTRLTLLAGIGYSVSVG